jgi:hypothetical protein
MSLHCGLVLVLLFASAAVGVKKDNTLESVSEDELVNLVRTEKHVVVAFSEFYFAQMHSSA